MKRLLSIFFLAAISALTTAAAEQSALYRYLYMEAVRQQDMDNYVCAMELYNRCIELNPDAPEANYALGTFYMAMQMDSIGLGYLRHAVELEPANTEFAERLARTYLYRNRIDDAAAVYERLTTLRPDRTDYLELLSRIYEQAHDYEKLLAVLNRVEIQEGQSEDLTLSKMQAYSYLGDQEGAYRELKSLTDAHPNDLNLQVMLGNWLLSNGRIEEAHNIFLSVLKEEPGNAQGQMSLMDFYRSVGDTAEADTLMYRYVANPHADVETRASLIRDYIRSNIPNGGDTLFAMNLLDHALSIPQQTSDIAELKVAYMMMLDMPKDSIRNGLERILDISPENIGARIQLIQIMWEDSIDENVIRECRKAVEYVPENPSLYYYLGVAQYVNKHYAEAITTLSQGASYIDKDTPTTISADLYAMLGDALHKENRIAEAYHAYDSCLVYDPDKVMCLNNYAYFLSLDKSDLKKAEKMSYRAITAEPDNATYLDTYAWVLYQQGRIEEAGIYIEQALRCDTDSTNLSGDIYEHAGDIYLALGRKTEAIGMWEKALLLGIDNEAIIRKKLKKHKK